KRFLDVSVNKIKPLSDLPKRVLLFCGLARPEILLQSLKIQFEKLDLKIEIDTFFLSDHQIYDENLLQKVINYQVTHKFFLTTEKDFIKFKEIWPSQKSLAVLLLEVELLQKEDEFYEAINHFLH
ncbi:MAG: tetraacyldisaccharide 4'-kinase, partial [Bdellovibrionaceae bacterium]|nr:tetraacyldisaccharide 4'-kinase [Pseudobdellovibrionaceae bacterium]